MGRRPHCKTLVMYACCCGRVTWSEAGALFCDCAEGRYLRSIRGEIIRTLALRMEEKSVDNYGFKQCGFVWHEQAFALTFLMMVESAFE